jgi:inward rectifier potassium channel
MAELQPPPNDLGFGNRLAEESKVRLLNRDGTFNVERAGMTIFQSLGLYHYLLTISWGRFYGLAAFCYFMTNVVFAAGYYLCGPNSLHGSTEVSALGHYLDDFFFSVQTLATIGYGRLTPNGLPANILVSIEALLGLLGFAVITGFLFARFSRPTMKIVFSERAVMAPYQGMKAFMIRIANQRNSQLVNMEATLVLSMREPETGKRKFSGLTLERSKVMFFPLHWVIVHPVDEASPMAGMTAERLAQSDAEFFVLLSATDEVFSQTVHSRASYKFDEVTWGAKFSDMFQQIEGGRIAIDLRNIHNIELVEQ